MTVSELYKQVAQLGFEDSLEDEDRFYYAANRALLQVNSIRPVTKAHIINHKPLENKIKSVGFEPIEKYDDLCFYAEDVKSYFFEKNIVFLKKMLNFANQKYQNNNNSVIPVQL